MLPARRFSELLAQFADEYINDFDFRLIHAAIEVVKEHFFCERHAFAQAEQFKDLVFFAGQVNRHAAGFDRFAFKVDGDIAGGDDGLAKAARAPYHCAQAGDQLGAVEGLGEVIIGAGDEAAHFIGDIVFAREDQQRGLDADAPQPPQNVIAVNVGGV